MKKYLTGIVAIVFALTTAFTTSNSVGLKLDEKKFFVHVSGSYDDDQSYVLTPTTIPGGDLGCPSVRETSMVCTVFATPVWDGGAYRPSQSELDIITENSDNFTVAADDLTYIADE